MSLFVLHVVLDGFRKLNAKMLHQAVEEYIAHTRHCTYDPFIPHSMQSILETRSAALVPRSPYGESLTITINDVLELFLYLSVHVKGRH